MENVVKKAALVSELAGSVIVDCRYPQFTVQQEIEMVVNWLIQAYRVQKACPRRHLECLACIELQKKINREIDRFNDLQMRV